MDAKSSVFELSLCDSQLLQLVSYMLSLSAAACPPDLVA